MEQRRLATSQWSTILLPSHVRLILNVWRELLFWNACLGSLCWKQTCSYAIQSPKSRYDLPISIAFQTYWLWNLLTNASLFRTTLRCLFDIAYYRHRFGFLVVCLLFFILSFICSCHYILPARLIILDKGPLLQIRTNIINSLFVTPMMLMMSYILFLFFFFMWMNVPHCPVKWISKKPTPVTMKYL